MIVVHFIENKTVVLTQFLKQVPSSNEDIKIKGRKGKVKNVVEIDENHYQVIVSLQPSLKNQPAAADSKKKKR
ncbi:hypothetical protein [Litchfieldia alkalitelluris]|uniref:hypothetical protein n=1 Tax=Litchfieldia alkalitelluris TaxID=304268 RepID=UPI000997068B|nr:hypothetical protein [Litchfieldia alkalitelluris]